MKKFSRFDLLNNALMDNAGGIVHRLFDAPHVRLYIKASLYDLKRAQVFVGTVNEIVEDEVESPLTLEKLIELFYSDFLRQIDQGTDLDTLAKWIRSIQPDPEIDLTINHYQEGKKDVNLEDIKKHYLKQKALKKEPEYIQVRLKKQHVLRGEVLLHDLHEMHPDLQLDVEEFLSLRFADIMKQIKAGDYTILQNIVSLMTF